MVLKKLKDLFGNQKYESSGEDYVEIDLNQEKKENKVMVKLFVLKDYEDSNMVLNAIREGYTIGIVDIRVLKKKDPIELKRAIGKIKKTVQALEGSIAGFGESTIIITPAFAKIDREIMMRAPKKEESNLDDF